MRYDVAVIGAGIMGLAHAYHAARAGLKTVVLDRSPAAQGASVRNFGMVAIVAQAPGEQLSSALRSLAFWNDIASKADIGIRQAGCLFLARIPEELSVLEECADIQNKAGHSFELLSAGQISDYAPNLRSDQLLGGLWSPNAYKVDQRQALEKITSWLQKNHDVTFHFSTDVVAATDGNLETTNGTIEAKDIFHCGGDDFRALFTQSFHDARVDRCQLQMLRTVPQPADWTLSPFILGGLSLPHYNVFKNCPSLPALISYQKENYAQYLKAGIHLIACQEDDGTITFGDSHLYGDEVRDERSPQIDELLMSELSELISLPNPQIGERWLGHYAKLEATEKLQFSPTKGVKSVTMTNGQGMTHSFSVAEKNIQQIVG